MKFYSFDGGKRVRSTTDQIPPDGGTEISLEEFNNALSLMDEIALSAEELAAKVSRDAVEPIRQAALDKFPELEGLI